MTRVAVIGAGLAGISAALRLSDAGVPVDLYERNAAPLRGASGVNEGKIHLGYVYAMDPSLRTTETMLRGAASFRRRLERWVAPEVFEANASEPFLYAVPRSSMLDPDAVRAHFRDVARRVRAHAPSPMMAPAAGVRELSAAQLEEIFDPAHVASCFESDEIAIEPVALGRALKQAVEAAGRITKRYACEVTKVEACDDGYLVTGRSRDDVISERYGAVVNAAWHRRLELDATMGLRPSRDAIHRYKCGLRTTDPEVVRGLPAVTFLVGEYGDTVAYGDSAYVSWYPTGLLSQEIGLSPKVRDTRLDPGRARALIREMLRNLRRLMPGATPVLSEEAGWEVVGGYITAWGSTGIDDARSELHDRYDVGVHSTGGYHSVDTGKYVLAPLFGTEAADRILAVRGSGGC